MPWKWVVLEPIVYEFSGKLCFIYTDRTVPGTWVPETKALVVGTPNKFFTQKLFCVGLQGDAMENVSLQVLVIVL